MKHYHFREGTYNLPPRGSRDVSPQDKLLDAIIALLI